MQTIPLNVIVLWVAAAVIQLIGMGLLPRTQGFTNWIPTLLCLAAFCVGNALLARLTYSGVQLSILIPLMSAIIQLGSIAIGILAYHEPASLLKLVLLIAACGLIVAASRVA